MIGVVHLVWGPLGPEPLRRFLRSLREHDAGAEHELVLLLNGVGASQRAMLDAELDGIVHRELELPMPVQDLVAYSEAAMRLEHARLCFVNSYSEVLADGWLAKLDTALGAAGVGAAGASGSWMSMRSLALNGLAVPNGYRGSLPPRREVFEQMRLVFDELDRRRAGDAQPEPSVPPGRLRAARDTLGDTAEQLARFPSFPNRHLRTNAFICERELFLSLSLARAARKVDAHALESGRAGITRRLSRLGLRTVVVDRGGASHAEESWPESDTFWQGDQEALLVADNQTGVYAAGGLQRRRVLAALAWGARARARVAEAVR